MKKFTSGDIIKMKFKYKYAITAKCSTSMTEYYTNSPTQGENMIPLACSMAFLFNNRKDAIEKMEKLKNKWRGMHSWKLRYMKIFL